MKNYNAGSWFWIVAGDETQVYSSAAADFVKPDDAAYVAFLEDGGLPTRIASMEELRDVLLAQAPAGWKPTASDLWTAYQGAALAALAESDKTMLRCAENSVTVPAAWATYRKALRAIVGASSGDSTQPLPAHPPYPANT